MKLKVTFGQDLSAYATEEIEVPDGASKEEIVDTLKGYDPSKLVFDEDWSTVCAMRIVSAVKEDGGHVLEDVPIEPSPFDCGQHFMSWLKGYMSLEKAVSSSLEFAGIEDHGEERHRGTFKLPGAGTIDVEFMCRKGATREEKDLAFFEALAQVGTVNYLTVGEVRHGV